MNRYPVLEPRFLVASVETNAAGRKFESFRVEFEPIGWVQAPTAQAALAVARRKGFFRPIIGQAGALQ